MTDRMKRMWINQPSWLQPFHKYHGVNVLFDVEAERIYFLSGDSVSSDIPSRLVLSEGWVENSTDAEEAHRRAKEAEEYNIGDALREVELNEQGVAGRKRDILDINSLHFCSDYCFMTYMKKCLMEVRGGNEA